jgi:hypothetical protein
MKINIVMMIVMIRLVNEVDDDDEEEVVVAAIAVDFLSSSLSIIRADEDANDKPLPDSKSLSEADDSLFLLL